MSTDRDYWNSCRFNSSTSGTQRGHYESWFQRANHPTRALAFWIRYTIFCPSDPSAPPEGELWAVYFNGESKKVTAVKQEFELADCEFSTCKLAHRIGSSLLDQSSLHGQATGQSHSIKWDLQYTSPQPPLLFLPKSLYETKLPAAKSVVGSPLSRFTGTLEVDGETINIENWLGSQNHNWGTKHTDEYAWGQVSGFDNDQDIFLELITARVKIGPKFLGLRSPWMTLAVLRVDGEEFAFNSIVQSLKAHAHYEQFAWSFRSQTRNCTIEGTIAASPQAFVALPYRNPPGGQKLCLNSKIAACTLQFQKSGQPPRKLVAQNRAAFEILTTDNQHDVPVLRT